MSNDTSMRTAPTLISLTGPQKYAAKHLASSWNEIPHVTHHEIADVTDLQVYLKAQSQYEAKVSFLGVLAALVADNLAEFPRFNATFDAETFVLALQPIVDIGFAIDTPKGLVVGVVRDCQNKGALELSQDVSNLAEKARKKGLPLADMAGGGFTISSLGGLGGTGFTPIVNKPQVAILGISRLREEYQRDKHGQPEWRQVVPLSLSYDHRVVNGVDAGRFMEVLRQRIEGAWVQKVGHN